MVPTTLVANGGTPMGGGIQMALEHAFEGILDKGNGRNRIIILLTDGEQNLNPMVDQTIADKISCLSGFSPANGITMTDNTVATRPNWGGLGTNQIILSSGPYARVKIYSIDIGANTTQVQDVLQNLSNQSGAHFAGSQSPSDVNAFFVQITKDWLQGCSPRILDSRNGKTISLSQPSVEAFHVNDSIQTLTVNFFATDEPFTSANIIVYKDGQAVGNLPIKTEHPQPNSILLQVDLQQNPGFSTAGLWEFRIFDVKPVSYRVTAFAEDKRIHHELSLGNNPKYYAGDDLPVSFIADYQGVGLSGGVAQAVLFRPGDDLGDLTANAPTPIDLSPFEPGGSLARAKIDRLMKDSIFRKKLYDEQRIITLKDLGNGSYTGTFKNNIVTGSYRVYRYHERDAPESKAVSGVGT